jgi:hypothetical protein
MWAQVKPAAANPYPPSPFATADKVAMKKTSLCAIDTPLLRALEALYG